MKIIFWKISVLLILLTISVSAFPQNRDSWLPPPFPYVVRDYFFTEPLIFYTKDSSRLDLYIEIPIDNIMLKRNTANNMLESSLELILNINNSNEESVINKSYTELISYKDNELKEEHKNSIYFVRNFSLEAGLYSLNLTIRDNNLNKEYSKITTFLIKDITVRSILFSDIMFLSDYKTNSEGKKEITPLVNNNVFNLKDFYIFFEIYNRIDTSVTKEFTYRISNDKNKIISEGNFTFQLSGYNNKEFEQLSFNNSEPGKFKLEIIDKSTQEIAASKDFVYFPHHLPPGKFKGQEHHPGH